MDREVLLIYGCNAFSAEVHDPHNPTILPLGVFPASGKALQPRGGFVAFWRAMMAGWIKMRGELVAHPKVVAMARLLNSERAFREWLTPGGGGPMNGQIVSNPALRCVTVSLLLCVWSRARESGEFVGNDLVLPHTTIDDLDEMSGAPGVGHAMVEVGWVVEDEGGCGVTLPNFKRYNAPMDSAERVRNHRLRAKSVTTEALHDVTCVTRQTRLDSSKFNSNSDQKVQEVPITLIGWLSDNRINGRMRDHVLAVPGVTAEALEAERVASKSARSPAAAACQNVCTKLGSPIPRRKGAALSISGEAAALINATRRRNA